MGKAVWTRTELAPSQRTHHAFVPCKLVPLLRVLLPLLGPPSLHGAARANGCRCIQLRLRQGPWCARGLNGCISPWSNLWCADEWCECHWLGWQLWPTAKHLKIKSMLLRIHTRNTRAAQHWRPARAESWSGRSCCHMTDWKPWAFHSRPIPAET